MVASIADLFAAEVPELPVSFAIKQEQAAWRVHGTITPAVDMWLAELDAASAVGNTRHSATQYRIIKLQTDLRVAVAVWRRLPAATREALLTQIETALQLAIRVSSNDEHTSYDVSDQEFASVQRIAHELNSTLNLDLILPTVLRESLALTGATHGAIALLDQQHTARYLYASGYSAPKRKTLLEYPLGSGISPADLALQERRSIVTGSNRACDVTPSGRLVSGLDVPILYQDHVVGLISLRSARTDFFSAAHLSMIELIAEHAALAIGNARHAAEEARQRELLQQRAAILDEVLEVGRLIRADRSLADMLTDIAYGIVNAIGFRTVVISLRDDRDPGTFTRMAFAGVLPENVERLRKERPSIDLIARLCDPRWQIGSSYYIPAASVREIFGIDFDRLTTSIRTQMPLPDAWHPEDAFLTPLHGPDRSLIGFISVDDPFDRRRPSRRTAETLEIFANQALNAIDNIRLYNGLQQKLQEADLINSLARALAAPMTFEDLADVLYAELQRALNASSVMLAIYDATLEQVEFTLLVDRGKRLRSVPRRNRYGIIEHLVRTRQPLLLSDDIQAQGSALGINMSDTMCRSFAGTPLLVGDTPIGVLAVQDYHRSHAFGQPELELLQAIALQIASGIEKSRLLYQRERQIAQMQALNTIGKIASSTLDLEEMFVNIYHELARYRSVDSFLLSLCDRATWTIIRILAFDDGKLLTLGARAIDANSFTDRIMRTGQPILMRNVLAEQAAMGINGIPTGSERNTHSWAGVPLIDNQGEAFGILSMQSYAIGEYDDRDIDFMSSIAHQIALNIQKASLFRQSQEQVVQLATEAERLELINRVSGWASRMPDLQELLQLTVNEMARMTNADQARLLFIDRERGVSLCQAEYRNTGAVGKLTIPLEGNPAFEWADRYQKPLLISDVGNDPRFASIHDYVKSENISDILIVPLVVKGEVIGTIGLDSCGRKHSFNERDIATCDTIANQVATALENARLWSATQQSVRELTMLYDLSVSLSTILDIEEILATLAGAVLEMARADFSAVAMLDLHGKISQIAGLTSRGDEVTADMIQGHPALLRVVQSAQPLVLDECSGEYARFRVDDQTQSCLFMPIVVKSQAVGCLIVATHRQHTWTERARSLMTILTTQAGSAIEGAHLFHSEQEKRRLADTLREVGVALTSTLDIQEVLEIILVQLRRVVWYDSASVELLRDDRHLEIISERSFSERASLVGATLPSDDPRYPNYLVVSTQRPHIVIDTHTEFPAFHALPQGHDAHAWLGVPLIYGNEMLGMIALTSYEHAFYTEEKADLALMFATQAAQAIAHARLFEHIRRFNTELEQKVAERTAALTAEKDRLEAVHAITTALTASLDIDEIVIKSLALAADAVGVNRGSILIRDTMLDTLMYRAVLSDSEGLIKLNEPFRLPPGNLVEWAMENQRGMYIDDVRNEPRWISGGQRTDDIRSFILVPLMAADVPLGVLMLNSRQSGFFNEEHFRLLATIGSEVAIAIHNAELYNFINEQAVRLAELLQIQREETGKNRAILESVAEGVLVIDEYNQVALCNRAANDALQITDESIVGERLERIAEHSRDEHEHGRALLIYDALAEGVRQARAQNTSWHTVVELPGQTIDAIFAPVLTPDGERIGVATVLRDITREIEADKAKREFISTVSHELRTPLTSVKGYVDLLLLGTAGSVSEMQQNFLQVIKSNAERLNSLVEDLLEISRLENGKVTLNIKPLSVPSLIDDIVASLRTETHRKRLAVQLEIEPLLPIVEADSKRVTQVLTNLLSNAHKYTREGGEIIVRAFSHNDLVQIDVQDTGVGIPPDDLPKMFGRFFRSNNALKDEVGGTGLGLSIAKSLVELHGGEMWVISTVNVGSTFSFTLPIEPRQQPSASASEPTSSYPIYRRS